MSENRSASVRHNATEVPADLGRLSFDGIWEEGHHSRPVLRKLVENGGEALPVMDWRHSARCEEESSDWSVVVMAPCARQAGSDQMGPTSSLVAFLCCSVEVCRKSSDAGGSVIGHNRC